MKKLIIGATLAISALLSTATIAQADGSFPVEEVRGKGSNWFKLCAEGGIRILYKYDEDSTVKSISGGTCHKIYSQYDWIEVDFDDDSAKGQQWETFRLNYPEDVTFEFSHVDNFGDNRYGFRKW